MAAHLPRPREYPAQDNMAGKYPAKDNMTSIYRTVGTCGNCLNAQVGPKGIASWQRRGAC